MKKAWDVKKIEENVGDDFPSQCMASACGIAMAHRGEHPMRALGADSTGTVPPAKVLPSGAQRHSAACATTRSGARRYTAACATARQLHAAL